MRLVIMVLLAALFCGMTSSAHAHGVGHVTETAPAQALRFYYSDGTPVGFAEAIVLNPGGDEFLVGRTDARGRFAFIPDAAGNWRITVSDGMGHRTEATVVIGNEAAAPPQQASLTGSLPPAVTAVLGISLIANLALGVKLVRKRRA